MKILLIGPQGSGKSTQGKLLADNLGIPFIVTGDILREIAASSSEEGKRLKQILDAGNLVDDQTVIKLVKERIQRPDCQAGFILDGTPRTLEQAEALQDINLDKVIYFKAPKDVVLERLLKRGRADDTTELINNRLDLYFKETEPLLEYFKNKGILVEVDGVGEIEDIRKAVKNSLS